MKNFIDDLAIKRTTQDIISLFGNGTSAGGGKFIVKTEGDSMIDAGINTGNHLIIDLLDQPKSNDIVVIDWNSALMVKRLFFTQTGVVLESDNENYEKIEINDIKEIKFLAKVVSVIKNYSKN